MTNFASRTFKGFLSGNWFQFVEDAVAVASLKVENQILLNLFSKWCRWSEMTIKTGKCQPFGTCKKGTTSTQYKPKLHLDNLLIYQVKLYDCLTYLSCQFDFKMTNDKHKSELVETATGQIEIIDKLPLQPKYKLKLSQHWTLSKLSWYLTVTNVSNTWMKNNIDNIASRSIRLWLKIRVNGTLKILT